MDLLCLPLATLFKLLSQMEVPTHLYGSTAYAKVCWSRKLFVTLFQTSSDLKRKIFFSVLIIFWGSILATVYINYDFIKEVGFVILGKCDPEREIADLVGSRVKFKEDLIVASDFRNRSYSYQNFKHLFKSRNRNDTHFTSHPLTKDRTFSISECHGFFPIVNIVLESDDGEKYLVNRSTFESMRKDVEGNRYYLLFAAIEGKDFENMEKLMEELPYFEYGNIERYIAKLIFRNRDKDIIAYERMIKAYKKKMYKDKNRLLNRNVESEYLGKWYKPSETVFYMKNQNQCDLAGRGSCNNNMLTTKVTNRSIEGTYSPSREDELASKVRLEYIPQGTTFKVIEKFVAVVKTRNGIDEDNYLVLEDNRGIHSEISEISFPNIFINNKQSIGKSPYLDFVTNSIGIIKESGTLKIQKCVEEKDLDYLIKSTYDFIETFELEEEISISNGPCPELTFKTHDALMTFLYFKRTWGISIYLNDI